MAYELFLESFDTWAGNTSSRWTSSAPARTFIQNGGGRRGTNALKFEAGYNATNIIYVNVGQNPTTAVIGFAFYRSRVTLLSYNDIFFRNLTTSLVSLRIDADGVLRTTLGGVTYSSNNSIIDNMWYYIEVGTSIGDSGTFEVRINGSSSGWIKLSGVDTKPSTTNTITNIAIVCYGDSAGTVTNTIFCDDLYITYGDELKWLGDIRVDAFALDGNATPQDWVPDTGNAWERLNQAAGNVKSNIINAESLFSVANISFDTPEVHGVQIGVVANKTDSGQRNMVIEANNNNITVNSSVIALGTSNRDILYSLTKDTDGANWTKQRFNDLKVGIKVVE